MRKIIYSSFFFFIIYINIFAVSAAISELPSAAVRFADSYFSDYYLYRAMEIGGNYTLIFKGGLKIYVSRDGEWNTISGGGEEISIEYLESKVKSAIKKEFPDDKVIYIQKKKYGYRLQFKSRHKIDINFDGDITKGRRD